MLRCLIAALVIGTLGCHEEFTPPDRPDLYKVPHDLGLDLSVEQPDLRDMSAQIDLATADHN